MISTMHSRRNVLAALMALALAAAVCIMAPAVAHADEGGGADGVELQTQGAIAKGTWGTCKWAINAKGTLTIKPGKGAEPKNSGGYFLYPWSKYSGQVKKVVFKAKGDKKVVAPTKCAGLLDSMTKVESIDLSGLDTSRVKSMWRMFYECSSLTSLDLSGLDTSNVEEVSYMFYGCKALETLDLSGFDTSNCVYFHSMFGYCKRLKTIYAPTFTGAWYTYGTEALFSHCTALVGGNGTKYSKKHTDIKYARVDAEGQPGYFTYKAA